MTIFLIVAAISLFCYMRAHKATRKNAIISWAFFAGNMFSIAYNEGKTVYNNHWANNNGRYVIKHEDDYYTCENQRNGRYCLGKDGFQVIIEETDWRRAKLGE